MKRLGRTTVMFAVVATLGLVLVGCGPTAGPGGTNPPGPVRSATVDDLTALVQSPTQGGSIVRLTVKIIPPTNGTFTLKAQGGYDFGAPQGTLCTLGTVVDASTCSWYSASGEFVGTFDVPIQGLTTNDPSTLPYQFELDGPSLTYPFVVDVPNVFSD